MPECRRDRLAAARCALAGSRSVHDLTCDALRLEAQRAADRAKKAAARRDDEVNARFVQALRCWLGLEGYAD